MLYLWRHVVTAEIALTSNDDEVIGREWYLCACRYPNGTISSYNF